MRENVFTQVDNLQETGVDLHNFAKQLLQYIDKHLMENIDGYLAISQSCSEILSTIRYYPYPAIVYKIAFNKLLNPAQKNDSIEKKVEQKATPIDIPRVKPQDTPTKKDTIPEKKQEEEIKNVTLAQDTPQKEATTQQEADTAHDTTDLAQLKDKLINAIDKLSLKSNLADNIIIESID